MTDETFADPAARRQLDATRLWLVLAGLVLVVTATALGAWAFSLGDDPFAVDVWWNTIVVSWESSFMLGFSLFMNFVGGGWFGVLVVPIGSTLALLVTGHRWGAFYLLVALIASAGFVQILKHLFGRVRPEEIIVLSDHGSFPSGHVANAATMSVAFLVIFPRLWVFVVGTAWVALMALSRTYVHAHWLSDTLGGACVGGGAALIVAALFVRKLAVEARARTETTLAARA
ncbi:phosphatase PAP2 family protein [Microbacterium sp. NPDC076911]|uniref:phosphatase PAP2 family protein n=1 Tax=Microbacterium sp. NPDC076911 TaxID=3154958 RepID=UPI003434BC9B